LTIAAVFAGIIGTGTAGAGTTGGGLTDLGLVAPEGSLDCACVAPAEKKAREITIKAVILFIKNTSFSAGMSAGRGGKSKIRRSYFSLSTVILTLQSGNEPNANTKILS